MDATRLDELNKGIFGGEFDLNELKLVVMEMREAWPSITDQKIRDRVEVHINEARMRISLEQALIDQQAEEQWQQAHIAVSRLNRNMQEMHRKIKSGIWGFDSSEVQAYVEKRIRDRHEGT